MNNFIVILNDFANIMKLFMICRRLEEGRFCRTLQWLLPTHISIFVLVFYVYSKVMNRVHNISPNWIFHFSIIRSLKNAFPKHFNSAYNKSKIYFRNYFLLYMKGGLPRPIHSILHQPHSVPSANFIFSFSMSVMDIFFFSRSDIYEKIKKSKIGK